MKKAVNMVIVDRDKYSELISNNILAITISSKLSVEVGSKILVGCYEEIHDGIVFSSGLCNKYCIVKRIANETSFSTIEVVPVIKK